MDVNSFDRLTRTIVTVASRRGLIGALLGAVPVLLGRADAEGRPRSQRRFQAQGPCGDGTVRDNVCTRHNQCCTRYCHKRTKRCRCRRRGQTCRSSRSCCSRRGQRMVCREGRCRAPLPCGGCPAGETCATGVGTCCPAADVCTVDGVANACCEGRGTCCGGVCCESGCCVGTTCVEPGGSCGDDTFCCGDGQCEACCRAESCPVPACQVCQGNACVAANEDGACGTCQVCQGGACVDASNGTSCGTCQVCQGGQCGFADACAGTTVACGTIGSSTCSCHKDATGASVCGLRNCQPCPTPGQPCAYNSELTGICISCAACGGGSTCLLVCTEPVL